MVTSPYKWKIFVLNIFDDLQRTRSHGYNFNLFCQKLLKKITSELFSRYRCIDDIFSSPELKTQVSFSDRLLSVVLLSVRLSVNFYIFYFFSGTTGPILTRLGTNDPWAEGILNCSNEGDCPSPRGDNSKRVKIFWIFKKSSPEPAGQFQWNLV
jgi:hypothetical protein